MAYNLSNVYPISDTFDSWIAKTNLGLSAISTVAVTTSPNTIGGYTTGNAFVNGIFSANTLVAVESLRGGTVATSGTLNLISNVDSQQTFINVFTTAANVVIGGSGKTMNVAVPTTVNANLNVSNTVSNVFIASTNTDIHSAKLNMVGDIAVWNVAGTGTKLFNVVSASNTGSFNLETLTVVANTTTTNVATAFTINGTGNVAIRGANTTIGNSSVFGVRVTSNSTTTSTTVGGNAVTLAANVTISAAQANVSGVVVNASNTTLSGSGNLAISTTTTNISSNVYVSGANVVFDGVVSFTNTVNFASDFTHVNVANGNIGTGNTSAINVYSFDKTSYSTAEVTATAKNGSQSQISKMLIAHDGGSNVYSTVYGTISAPNTANLGVFTTTISGSNVFIRFQQTTDNTAVKLKINLIK